MAMARVMMRVGLRSLEQRMTAMAVGTAIRGVATTAWVPAKSGGGDMAPVAGAQSGVASLVEATKAELEYEKEDTSSADALKELAGSFAPFTLVDTPGSARFHLTRTVKGKEVRLDLDCSPVPMDDEEEDEEGGQEEGDDESESPAEGYRMLVSLTDRASGEVMQVGALVGDFVKIHRVTLHKIESAPTPDQVFGGADEVATYAGPVFDDLDDKLYNAFYDYLDDFGVTNELAANLADYCSHKEQQEYVRWLGRLHSFAAKK